MTPVVDPTLSVERRLFRAGHAVVIGCDEVGRGAIAGPVAVGMTVIDQRRRRIPVGLRDSKMLSEAKRELLAPVAAAWAVHSAVGLAGPEEVDAVGIIEALGRAGARALAALREAIDLSDAVVLLDGSHDWLTRQLDVAVTVMTRVKADQDCGSVAAASVLAKVHRDRMMIDAHESAPVYGWSGNKGYGSSAHYAAIAEHGPHAIHRHSWLREPALVES